MPEEIIVRHEFDLGQLQQFENILKAVGSDTGAYKEVTAELKKQVTAQQEVSKETKNTIGIVGDLLKEQKRLKDAQKYAETKKELSGINKELRTVQKELKKAKETTAGWTTALGSFAFKFNALANIAAGITSTITGKLSRALSGAIDTVRDFESAMAGVRAISEATDEQFKKLNDDAIRLGGSTIYTATAVASLQMNYAKLGFSSDEILAATEATLQLAAATDEGLAESALVAGSTLRAFQMDAIETKRVVDVMAKSFTSSALNLEHWKESMKFSASIAQGTGLSVETAAAAFAVLADAGIKGSIAGTSFKNILLRMSDASSRLSRTVGFAVRNSEQFIKALKILKERGTDLTEVFELTDRRAAPSLRILIELSDAVEIMDERMDKAADSAKKMAEIRMDTLKGSITILKSAWEGLIISFEQGNNILTVVMRGVVDWVTKVIMKVKELTLKDKEFIEQWGQFEGSKKIQEFSSSIKDSKDKLGDYQTELARVIKEYKLVAQSQDEANKLLETNTEIVDDNTDIVEEHVKELTTWQKVTGGVLNAVASSGVELRDAGVATKELAESTKDAGTATDELIESTKDASSAINVNSKEWRDQKKEIDKTEASLAAYIEELSTLISQIVLKEFDPELLEEDKAKATIELEYKTATKKAEIAFEARKREIYELQKDTDTTKRLLTRAENEKSRLVLEARKKMYADLRYYALPQEEAFIDLTIAYLEEQIANIDIGFDEEMFKWDIPKQIAYSKRILKIAYENQKNIAEERAKQEHLANEKSIRDTTIHGAKRERLLKKAEYDLHQELLKIKILWYEQQMKIIPEKEKELYEEIIKTLKAELEVPIDTTNVLTWQEAYRTSVTAITGYLQGMNDQEQKILDDRIKRFDVGISELQRKLENEYDLQRAGLANRVNIMEQDLAAQEKARNKALRQKEKADKKERQLNALMQVSNLALTASDILEKAQSQGGVWGWLLGIVSIGAMLLAFFGSIADISGDVYEEGGWVDGKPHSRGGKWVNAEGGEFIIRKNVAHKYPGILEALNKDDIHSVWNDLNMGLNRDNIPIVNVNSKGTEDKLDELIRLNKQMPRDMGDEIWYYEGGTKIIIKKK